MKCSYCGNLFEPSKRNPEKCTSCGGSKPERQTIEKFDPFFYDGYIVYALKDECSCNYQFIFYKGIDLMAEIRVDYYEMCVSVKEGEEYMPSVMKKLEEKLQCQTATP